MTEKLTGRPLCNLVLIGGRGSGKSALARRIQRINKHFTLFVLDELIRYEASGHTIPEIVATRGWPGFRDLEYEVVRKVSGFPSGALVDCGGGVVVDLDANGAERYSRRKVDDLRRHGRIVYLRRDPEYLLDRIRGDTNRPDLSSTLSFLEIMTRRDPWYREAADLVLECGSETKRQLVRKILEWFFDSGQAPRQT